MASVRLFVYGSLKRGGAHHEELRGARFLGEARTAPGFTLVRLGAYLALVPTADTKSDAATSVPGEVFEVPADLLAALDAFEGREYERGEVPLASEVSGLAGARTEPKNRSEKPPVTSALAYFKKSR